MAKLTKRQRVSMRRRQYKATAHVLYRCRTCEKRKYGDEFDFDPRYMNGRMLYRCSQCAEERRNSKLEWKKNRKKVLKRKAAMKRYTCRTCGQRKWGHAFVFHWRFKDGVYVSACKECKRKKDKEYYEQNADDD